MNMITARENVLALAHQFEYLAALNTVDSNDKQAEAAANAYNNAASALATLAGRMLVEGIEQEGE